MPDLTGTAPYRIEACGYAGANYQCIYSVAQGPGTANVTPITTAIVLLASGQSPRTDDGASTSLSASAVDGAQTTLRSGLASVLAAGNVPATFDFVSGALDAGSRSGYDKVLDAIGVSTGVDGSTPFVQITPRLGTGNLYLERNVTAGTLRGRCRRRQPGPRRPRDPVPQHERRAGRASACCPPEHRLRIAAGHHRPHQRRGR